MTKEEFEEYYIENSKITPEIFSRYFVTLPCACDYEGCRGWAAVRNDPMLIKDHNELYAPKTEKEKI